MNKFYLSIVATLLTYSLLAAPFQKLPYTIKQPNGTLIECFMSGDEFLIGSMIMTDIQLLKVQTTITTMLYYQVKPLWLRSLLLENICPILLEL